MAEKLNKLNLFVNETTASTSAILLIIEEDMEKVINDIGKMDKNMSKKILDLTRRNDKLQSNSINIKDKTSTSPLSYLIYVIFGLNRTWLNRGLLM